MKSNRKCSFQWRICVLLTVVVAVMIACGIALREFSYDQASVNAGETASFSMTARVEPRIADNGSTTTRLVAAFCCPKIWNPRENGNVRIFYESDTRNPGKPIEMTLIPAAETPAKGTGAPWEAHLWSMFGRGPNVLDEMQWVTFWGDVATVVNNEDMNVKISIKAKTSMENMRVKLGFYVNHTSEGGTSGTDHYGVGWGDCFEVLNGEGDIIDFCELHANQNIPMYATKHDIVTVKYFGGIIADDPLNDFADIYMSATAYTGNGNTYPKTELNEGSKMGKEGQFGRTFSKTFWPVKYFGIPEGEEITRIEYVFTNADGSVLLKENVTDDGGAVIDQVPFRFLFDCK